MHPIRFGESRFSAINKAMKSVFVKLFFCFRHLSNTMSLREVEIPPACKR
jgi:hypothetical protein